MRRSVQVLENEQDRGGRSDAREAARRLFSGYFTLGLTLSSFFTVCPLLPARPGCENRASAQPNDGRGAPFLFNRSPGERVRFCFGFGCPF